MKVYVVTGLNGVYGVYATREQAEAAKKEANLYEEMCGGRQLYSVEEHEVKGA